MSSPPTVMLTKEQLKNALMQRGLPLPPASARKEEFQKLYDEKVLPHQNRNEFSSDDEQDSASNVNESPQSFTQQQKSKVQAMLKKEIKSMPDFSLYIELQENGFNCGPVVESTRALYEHQLLGLRSKKMLGKDSNGHHVESKDTSANGNGFSDSDDEAAVETASRASRSSKSSQSSLKKRGRNTGTNKPVPEPVAPAFDAGTESSRDKTPSPPKPRVLRRSETPKTLRPETFNIVESRIPEMGRQSDRGIFQSMDSGISSGVSYFKERPGYASTTTSNILPRKPTPTVGHKDEFKDQKKNVSRSPLILVVVVLVIAIAIAIGGGVFYSMGNQGAEPEKDELDQLLDTMED